MAPLYSLHFLPCHVTMPPTTDRLPANLWPGQYTGYTSTSPGLPHLLHLPNQQPPTQFYKVQFSPTSLPDCVSSKGPQAGEEKSPNLPPFALNSVCGTSVFMLCPYSSMPYLPNLPAPLSPASSSQRELITWWPRDYRASQLHYHQLYGLEYSPLPPLAPPLRFARSHLLAFKSPWTCTPPHVRVHHPHCEIKNNGHILNPLLDASPASPWDPLKWIPDNESRIMDRSSLALCTYLVHSSWTL